MGVAFLGQLYTLFEAALYQEWAQRGYAALSMEAIAKRAKVGKSAIYRRWPSKLVLVSDVLRRVGTDATICPDTGDLHSDIRLLLFQLHRLLLDPLVARILPDLHAEMPLIPELAHAIRTQLQSYRRDKADAILSSVGVLSSKEGRCKDIIYDGVRGQVMILNSRHDYAC